MGVGGSMSGVVIICDGGVGVVGVGEGKCGRID